MSSMDNEPMLELFVFETFELVSQLENITLNGEKENTFESQIDEVFRIVHTIKGSAAMMNFENIMVIPIRLRMHSTICGKSTQKTLIIHLLQMLC